MLRLGSLGIILLGCLPVDTRSPPASVLTTLRGAATTLNGVTTTDGWRIQFDRVLVTVGSPSLRGDGCSEYSGAEYFRLFDARVSKPQKVGLGYGLGTCDFGYRARNPENDTVLAEGATEVDKSMMRVPGGDAREELAGITFLIRGSAQRAAERKTFDWSYRRRRVRYDKCKSLQLSGDQSHTIELTVHAEALFLDALDLSKAKLVFSPIAAADSDGDGVVTIAELDKIELANAKVDLTSADGTPLAEAKAWKTFGDFVYDGLFPRIVRVGDDTPCELAMDSRDH